MGDKMQRVPQKNKLGNLKFYNHKKSKINISSPINFIIKTLTDSSIGKPKLSSLTIAMIKENI